MIGFHLAIFSSKKRQLFKSGPAFTGNIGEENSKKRAPANDPQLPIKWKVVELGLQQESHLSKWDIDEEITKSIEFTVVPLIIV